MTAAPRPIVLDADGRKRLRASIAHWKRLATGKRPKSEGPYADDCALCTRWLIAGCATSSTDKCPVYQATRQSCCKHSPYRSASKAATRGLDSPEFRLAAEVELEFLRDLLARAEMKPAPASPVPWGQRRQDVACEHGKSPGDTLCLACNPRPAP